MPVDSRPSLARGAERKVTAVLVGIAAMALLGGGLAAAVVVHLTTPPRRNQ